MQLQSAVHFAILLFIFPVVSGKFMKQTKKCKSVYEQQNGGKYQFISQSLLCMWSILFFCGMTF